ncbi:hypothetical protein THAOC_34675 [Thalassiosira oceanica]|uniref:Uncharacterized protein n=1 Tax=Thalassiosira oceanica TaxID=159749 RepID=K0RIZ0_THAOC|nr:hypothetical protein THAOC_34675 [Thalassiosira oceanica]|eukprot:EJK46647.1 hypothetical protein THAOC_34675 [Thalassiosira oceanica]
MTCSFYAGCRLAAGLDVWIRISSFRCTAGGPCHIKGPQTALSVTLSRQEIASYLLGPQRVGSLPLTQILCALLRPYNLSNYPTGRQRVNDSGSHLSAEAIFEVKTFVGCNSRYGNNNARITPADRRANQVCQAYLLKTKKLDDKFAPEIVGDGTGNVVGPFQTMLGRFYRGQVLPVCAGWFGDINIDFDKIIRQLARKAAAGDHGLRISPLVNNDRKGGAFPIMLHQFRRAIGVAIVRGNAQHKLSRLHYVRAAPEEAADACSDNHSSNRWNSHRHGQSNWFSQHTPDGPTARSTRRIGYAYYERGEGVQRDKAKAAEFYKKAAMQGHVESRYNLGWLEIKKRNYDRALRHYLIFRDNGGRQFTSNDQE